MGIYCVSYDLIKQKDYPKLFEALKSFSSHSHALGSTWFIKTDKTAEEIRDKLKSFIDEDDKIIVIEVKKHWASQKMSGNAGWLKKNL
jgi:hypothetical protein